MRPGSGENQVVQLETWQLYLDSGPFSGLGRAITTGLSPSLNKG